MNIYIGNLSNDTSENSLQAAFEEFGAVKTVRIISDRDSGRFKGFGFVEMDNTPEAVKAISGLNETDLEGSSIKVNEAKPKAEGGGNRRSENRF